MPRKLKFTKGRFMREYKLGNNMMEIAFALNVTVPTAYNYCARYNLPAKSKSNNIELSLGIFNKFKGITTLENLSQEYGMSRQMIRYHLNKAIYEYWNTTKQYIDLPRPKKLDHIKVFHMIHKNIALRDNPLKVSELTGTTFYCVESYFAEIFKLRTKKKTKKKSRK